MEVVRDDTGDEHRERGVRGGVDVPGVDVRDDERHEGRNELPSERFYHRARMPFLVCHRGSIAETRPCSLLSAFSHFPNESSV